MVMAVLSKAMVHPNIDIGLDVVSCRYGTFQAKHQMHEQM